MGLVGIREDVVPSGAGTCRLLLTLMTVIVAGVASASLARAEGCPNEQIRNEQVHALRLPDCRAYEQVSPVEKNEVDAAGDPGLVQGSPAGDDVSFFADTPFLGTPGAPQIPTYLGVRSIGGNEWSTEGLLPEADPGQSGDGVIGLTEDLAKTILRAEEPLGSIVLGAMPGTPNAYVRDNATATYQLLAPNIGFEKLSFADATPGGTRILFETKAQLTADATPGVSNLYEWDEAKSPGERLGLVGVLSSGKAPEGGSVAGPGGPALPLKPGGSASGFYTQNTISEDGARIFFTEASGQGIIYMREPEAERTVQVSAGNEPAYWRAATPSGLYVFYTEGEDLSRYDVEC